MTDLTLTIAIPTYNRSGELKNLLSVLERELVGLDHRVKITISNNCSTDDTSLVVNSFARRMAGIKLIEQTSNEGMDANFSACASSVDTTYLWIIGDDDLPREGAIKSILSLLDHEKPDLVFLNSHWTQDINAPGMPGAIESLKVAEVSPEIFCRRAGVWLTYLSAMIVRTTSLMKDSAYLETYRGTNLIHLAWVLDSIKPDKKLLHVETECVFATAGNSGGYKVLEVFVKKFPQILLMNFEGHRRPLVDIVLKRASLNFLPRLLRGVKRRSAGDFEFEDGVELLQEQFSKYGVYHLILKPIAKYPPRFTLPIIAFADLWSGIQNQFDKFYELRDACVKTSSHSVMSADR